MDAVSIEALAGSMVEQLQRVISFGDEVSGTIMNENPDDSAFKEKSKWQWKDVSESNNLETGESRELPATFHTKSVDSYPARVDEMQQQADLEAKHDQGNVLHGVLIFAALLFVDVFLVWPVSGGAIAVPVTVCFTLAILVAGAMAGYITWSRFKRRGHTLQPVWEQRGGSLGTGVAALGLIIMVLLVVGLAMFHTRKIDTDGGAGHLPVEAYEAKTASKHGNFQAAVDKYSIAIAKEPRNPLLYEERAFCYLELSEDKKGLADLTQVLNLNASPSELAKALDLRARYNFKLGRYVESVEDCTRAIAVEPPQDGNFYRDRASAYKKLGLFAEAKKDLETADAPYRESTK
jgi:hypothetical protein